MAQSSGGLQPQGQAPQPSVSEVAKTVTDVTYHIDDEDAPYRTKIPKPPEAVTLADFKAILPARLHQFKYFFKNKDAEFGIVKQEILDETSNLPIFDGKIVSWLVATEGSMVSEGTGTLSGLERGPGVGQTRPPSFHGGRSNNVIYDDDTESAITSVSQQAENMRSRRPRMSNGGHSGRHQNLPRLPGPGIPAPGPRHQPATETETSSSMMSSEIESSIYESEDVQSQASSRFTTSTDHTSVSRQLMNMRHRPKKRSSRRVPPHLARAGSMSSVTDSTMSLNIITVTLNMDTVNFLGISIVGQSSREGQGDCGIYVGSIMKGGAVALDGRIDPGDMILQVNDISFDNMSNDDAVKVLKDVVQKPGPIRLVVAKSWDPAPSSQGRGGLSLPRSDPVRPIDPGAWVAHTAAIREAMLPDTVYGDELLVRGSSRDPLLGDFPGRAPSMTTLSASSVVSSQPETERYLGIHHNKPHTTVDAPNVANVPLTKNSGMQAIINRLRQSDSGLEVKDRTWLKLQIPNAFLGSELVQWLCTNVEGFEDRKEARKYAVHMLKNGFIKDTVNKETFSEQCYYQFGTNPTMSDELGRINLNDSNETNLHGPVTMTTGLPLPSGGSGGSGGGIWGAGMTSGMTSGITSQQPSAPTWEMPYMGPPSGGASTTTYGPIYNPTAPPPSAAYGMSFPGYGQPPSSSGSGSHRSNNRLMLAGSGSGSESASDGRTSSLMGSDKSSLIRNQQGLRQGIHPQTVFQGH